MGVAILLFYRTQLMGYLGNYIYLYYLGLFLNTALVVILLFVMISRVALRVWYLAAKQCSKNCTFSKNQENEKKN